MSRHIYTIAAIMHLFLLANTVSGASGPYMPEKYPPAVWYSTGDLIYVYAGIPMESASTISASFDIFQKYHRPYRLLWRDAQIEWYDKYFIFMPESQHAAFMNYWAEHNKANRATELAAKAAKERHIEFWGILPILDNSGGSASAQTLQGRGPFYGIDRFRKAHPEYAATDAAGIMSVPGSMEYAFPQVRKEMVKRFDDLFGKKGAFRFYDGLQFYTYVENFCARFQDEYIYSPFVNKEYKKRFGKDPKKENIDTDKYNQIRGEFFTQLLRDIRPVFKKHNKKLCMVLDAANPDIAQRWMCGGEPYVLSNGRMKIEWRKFIREGLVDELCIWQGTPENYRSTVPAVLKEIQGTPVKLSIHTDDELPDDLKYVLDNGVRIENEQMSAEAGYDEFRPATDINSSDDMAVLKVINESIKGIVPTPPVETAVGLLKRSNPSIRRQAANLIGMCNMKQAESALRQALLAETEEYVRPMYVANLGRLGGLESVRAIVDAIAKHPGMPIELSSVDAFNFMGQEDCEAIISAYQHSSPAVRMVVVHEWLRLEEKASQDTLARYVDMLIKAAKEDPVDEVRRMATASLGRFATERSCSALFDILNDKCHANQSKAAFSIASILPTVSADLRSKSLAKLLQIFKQYGKKSNRTDADWGWYPVGYAITAGCGETGKDEMRKILNGADKKLAQMAWRVLFTRDDGNWDIRPQEQVQQEYLKYPK